MITEICFEELLLKCTQEVFETMIFMDLSEICAPENRCAGNGDSFLGSITFKGNLEGCLSIACSDICAQLVTCNMLGMDEYESVGDEEINDAIGEVANMIMGNLKASLEGCPFNIELSIPTVVKGSAMKQHLSDMSGHADFETFLEDVHPLNVLLEYRLAPDLENDDTFKLC